MFRRVSFQPVPDKIISQCIGFTVVLKPNNSFFISILPAIFSDEQQLFETFIHEVAHAVHFCLKGGEACTEKNIKNAAGTLFAN